MPDLLDRFDMLRGDLIYGQSRDRGHAQTYLSNNHDAGPLILAAINAGAFITVDNYNYGLDVDQAYESSSHVLADRIDDKKREQFQTLMAALNIDDFRTYLTNRSGFWGGLETNRLGPLAVLNAPLDKLVDEGWADVWKCRYYLAIRRACKFGIQHVAANAGQAKIHFILNRFDTDDGWVNVLLKNTIDIRGRVSMLITYSELRFVYKNWDTFRGQISFYRYVMGPGGAATSFPSCDAPWEDRTTQVPVASDDPLDPPMMYSLADLWDTYYVPGKAVAYKRKATEMLDAATTKRAEAEVLVRAGDANFDAQNWGEAVVAYKAAVRTMRS